jgi:hypothetical protein
MIVVDPVIFGSHGKEEARSETEKRQNVGKTWGKQPLEASRSSWSIQGSLSNRK